MHNIEDDVRETVAKHVAGVVDTLEGVGLRRDLIIDGIERALKTLQKGGQPMRRAH